MLLTSLFFAVALNTAFFGKVLEIYPLRWSNALFLASLFGVLFCATAFLLNLLCFRFVAKPILVILFIVSSLANYFMSTYGIVMDTEMLTNILQTSPSESFDLANPMLFANLIFLGLIPSLIVLVVRIDCGSIRRWLLSTASVFTSSVASILILVFLSASTFASFLREHKPLRYYTNPVAFIYSVAKLTSANPVDVNVPMVAIAEDARRKATNQIPKLIVFVVGETARADRFSVNGYERETNPMLSQEDIVSLTNVMSAGTSTSVSVPSMFSHLGRADFSSKQARHSENLLDVLERVGVSVLWRDNNSDSKGVALRVSYENFRNPALNPIGEEEPRDEGMLYGLQDYVDEREGDIFIVLHQMGSHGPAYYRRYPKEFEMFKPVCQSSQLEKCSQDEINNAYDNTILYTDYFLSKVIAFLKENEADHQTAMLYFSDHGESLGETNMYLHGYPYSLAPIEQKHVPAILWFGDDFPVDKKALKRHSAEAYSHDYIFHTVLGLFNVATEARNVDLDLVESSDAYLHLSKEEIAAVPGPPAFGN